MPIHIYWNGSNNVGYYTIISTWIFVGALPLAEVTIYYMDIRTFGKGYEQFYQNAKAMGVEFVRGQVANIREDE